MSKLYLPKYAGPNTKERDNEMSIEELKHFAKVLNIPNHEHMKLHELEHSLRGEGFYDWIPTIKDTVKQYIGYIPEPIKKTAQTVFNFARNNTSFNRKTKTTLEKYGNKRIQDIQIFKRKIGGNLRKAITYISDSNENLYHLGLLITLDDGTKLTCEKNHVINIVVNEKHEADTEYLNVNLHGQHFTLNELLNNTIKAVGKDQFFEYNSLGGRNCQNFVIDVLRSNHLLIKQYEDFTLQNLDDLKKSSYLGEDTEGIAKFLTDTRNIVDNLTGYGVKNKKKR